jgi:hypothetical protein
MTETNREFPEGIADPGIETVLECRIETASTYQLGQPMTIEGTLHNSSSSAVWVLSWNTFLDPEWQDCVSVTHDGSPVPYVGVAVFRLAPGRDSYLRIPAGESVSRQIDLSQKYAITEPGDYEVSFDLPILAAMDEGDPEPPADDRALQLTFVKSAKASFRVGGVASTPSSIKAESLSSSTVSFATVSSSTVSFANSLPDKPLDPIFDGFNPKQEALVHRAHWTAYRNIYEGLERLHRLHIDDNESYNLYFDHRMIWGRQGGLGWEKRREIVIRTLTQMATWMSTRQVLYQTSDEGGRCTFNTTAWTYVNVQWGIHLCPNFFNDDRMRVLHYGKSVEWARAFTLVHEISHATGGTYDTWSNWPICMEIAEKYPDFAVTNAESYALYVMMRVDDSLPKTRTYAVRCRNHADDDKFLGWLDSLGNWVILNGDDPDTPPKNGYLTVVWYEHGSEKYLKSVNASRYVGTNGEGNKGSTQTAWNLWARATAVEWTESTGRISIKANPSQHLGVYLPDKRVFWASDPLAPWTSLKCEFVEVTG